MQHQDPVVRRIHKKLCIFLMINRLDFID